MDLRGYAEALREQNAQLVDLLTDADLSTPVPTCPGWTLKELARHVGRGDRWAAQIVADRLTVTLDPREVRGGKPPRDRDGTSLWLRDSPKTLFAAVTATGAATPVWTFTGPRRAGWWVRRRAYETAVHRADVALALGAGFTMPTALAIDAVSEWLDLVAARRPDGPDVSSRPPLDPGAVLRLRATDAPGAASDDSGSQDGAQPAAHAGDWLVRADPAGVSWTAGPGSSTVLVQGSAVDLLLAVTGRSAQAVEVTGQPKVWTEWLARTSF